MGKIDRAGSLFLRAVLRRMKELGLNNTTLAQRMNVSRPYVVKVLHGDVTSSLGLSPYGRWSASAPAPYKAGERIRMSAGRYRDWYANDAFRVARCYARD